MSNVVTRQTYKGVKRVIDEWPLAERLALAQDILKGVSSELSRPGAQKDTLQHALGLLRTANVEPPSDDQIERWLEEDRLDKYAK